MKPAAKPRAAPGATGQRTEERPLLGAADQRQLALRSREHCIPLTQQFLHNVALVPQSVSLVLQSIALVLPNVALARDRRQRIFELPEQFADCR